MATLLRVSCHVPHDSGLQFWGNANPSRSFVFFLGMLYPIVVGEGKEKYPYTFEVNRDLPTSRNSMSSKKYTLFQCWRGTQCQIGLWGVIPLFFPLPIPSLVMCLAQVMILPCCILCVKAGSVFHFSLWILRSVTSAGWGNNAGFDCACHAVLGAFFSRNLGHSLFMVSLACMIGAIFMLEGIFLPLDCIIFHLQQ